MFKHDWTEESFGKFVGGRSVVIAYDASRLPGRDTRYGQRQWSIFAEYKFDEGQLDSRELAGPKVIGGILYFYLLQEGEIFTN